jgi:hypothetical protein
MAKVARDDAEGVLAREVRREEGAERGLGLLANGADDDGNNRYVLPAQSQRGCGEANNLPLKHLADVREVHLETVLVLVGGEREVLELACRAELLDRCGRRMCEGQ